VAARDIVMAGTRLAEDVSFCISEAFLKLSDAYPNEREPDISRRDPTERTDRHGI
jgi:hypothetical protein